MAELRKWPYNAENFSCGSSNIKDPLVKAKFQNSAFWFFLETPVNTASSGELIGYVCTFFWFQVLFVSIMPISFNIKRCAFNETELYWYDVHFHNFYMIFLKDKCICIVLVLYLFGACQTGSYIWQVACSSSGRLCSLGSQPALCSCVLFTV